MIKTTVAAAALLLAGGLMAPGAAQAAGCLKGAVAGGLIGHYAGHHGLLGAGIGCLYEHHQAAKRANERQAPADDRY